MQTATYTCVVYKTVTGRIVSDFPLADQPQWTRQLNTSGSIKAKVRSGDTGVPSIDSLYGICVPKMFSLAVLWGDYVCQAGPIQPYDVDDNTQAGILELGTGSLWTLLEGRLLHDPGYDPQTVGLNNPAVDVNVTDSLPNIALTLVRNAANMTARSGSSLPLDIPANSGTGTNVRSYPGYDMVSVGQRLHELTQVEDGPDVDFEPYLTSDSTGQYIRHRMRVGRVPDGYLVQPGIPPRWDYGSTLRSVKISGDGSDIASDTWVKGSGDKYSMLYGHAYSSTLTDAGWPLQDYIDTTHTSATNQDTLDGWAAADLALHGQATEQWSAYVDANRNPALGAYSLGTFGTYNIQTHPWIRPGQYSVRILGLGNGRAAGEVAHILQGRGPF